jgi:hypothetical protein
MKNQERIGRFDQVRITTTKHVNYLSAPAGVLLNPNGIWLVAGVVGNELMLTKDSIVIKISSNDVVKVLDYHKTYQDIITSLGRFTDYETGKERPTEKLTRLDEED